jgi:hypothetical protein
MHIADTTSTEFDWELKDLQKDYTWIQLWNKKLFVLRKAQKQTSMIYDTNASKRFLTEYKIKILNNKNVMS